MSYMVCATYGESFKKDPLTGTIQQKDPVTKQVSTASPQPINQPQAGFGVAASPKSDKGGNDEQPLAQARLSSGVLAAVLGTAG